MKQEKETSLSDKINDMKKTIKSLPEGKFTKYMFEQLIERFNQLQEAAVKKLKEEMRGIKTKNEIHDEINRIFGEKLT